jgi:hypothetical protein
MRKKTVLIALVILALGLVGTGLSALYTRNEYIGEPPVVTFKKSYGFPLVWHGYSLIYKGWIPYGFPSEYWFSLESLLLDAAFWFVISFFVSFVALKSARALNLVARIRAGVLGMKTSIILLAMSLLFIVIGVGLCLFAQTGTAQAWFGYVIRARYFDLGLRLIGSGTATLIATLSVMLWKPSNVRVRQGYADAPNSHEV